VQRAYFDMLARQAAIIEFVDDCSIRAGEEDLQD
jgi:hypothetical protein